MRLYLVQHGEAVSKEADPNRPLTDKGREDANKTAEFLKTSGMNVDLIWHSTKTRAIETAQILAKALLLNENVEQKEGLAPNDPVKAVFSEALSIKKDIMIVSHLPFLQKLASLAFFNSESEEIIRFSMGGVVCLEQNESEKWQLLFEVIPDLLK